MIRKKNERGQFFLSLAYHNVHFYETTRHTIANILVHQILFIFDAISNKKAKKALESFCIFNKV